MTLSLIEALAAPLPTASRGEGGGAVLAEGRAP
jgi:hypothetical protein